MNRKAITIVDQSGRDNVSEFLDELLESSRSDAESKRHLAFIQLALKRISLNSLDVMCNEWTQLDINIDGQNYTKRYLLIKSLSKEPIYELRYGISANSHLRFLFFPIHYSGITHYVFCYVFIKTLKPNVDKTNYYMKKAYDLYELVKDDPKIYLGDD